MPSALTAENGAKALLSGEFHETFSSACPACGGDVEEDDCGVCEGSGTVEIRIPVSWTTIKAIYAMAVEHLGSPA
ncbi:hypothetical protein KAF44_32505 [Cupriavidus necator]|nr:hypothetical protein KAF44_32505 [Cupriavidus necator]